MDANCTVRLFDQTNVSDAFTQLKSVCQAWMAFRISRMILVTSLYDISRFIIEINRLVKNIESLFVVSDYFNAFLFVILFVIYIIFLWQWNYFSKKIEIHIIDI